MPGLSDTHEVALLRYIFNQTNFASPATTGAFSLHSPANDDAGSNELAHSGGYERVALAPEVTTTDLSAGAGTNWNQFVTSGTAKRASNLLNITFPQATAAWNSSVAINNWGYWTSATYGAGTFIISGTITGGVIVLASNTLVFSGGTPGALTFDVD